MGVNRKLNDTERREVAIALGSGISRSKLAEKYNVSYNTIKRIEQDAKNGKSMAKVYKESANIAEESNKKILEILESTTPYRIVEKIMYLLDDEDLLRKEISNRGISGVNSLMKTFIEASFKAEELKIKKQQAKEGLNVHIDDNIGKILDLMGDAIKVTITPEQEIAEFTKEKDND